MRFVKLGLLSLLAAAFAPAAFAAQDLQVVSASPKGEGVRASRAAVTVNFNVPVTALSEQAAFASGQCPLKITPAVDGTCRFSGTQTLLFEPKENWHQATEYTLTLPAGFKSQVSGETLAQDYSWTFATARPQVTGVTPYNNELWIDRRPLIYITLSQPAEISAVSSAVSLSYVALKQDWMTRLRNWLGEKTNGWVEKDDEVTEQSTPLQVRALTDEEYEKNYSYLEKDRVFVLVPQADLPAGTKITLTVSESLRGKAGTLGMAEPYTSVFYTYPDLKITGGNYAGCLPFDAHVDFSSPVRLADLLKHIKVSPQSALAEVTEQEAQTLGRQRIGEEAGEGWFEMPLSFLRLQPKESVTLTIDKDLTDIYGNRLGEEKVIEITNEGYCPAATFKGGRGVLESYLPARHPVDVLNVDALEVSAGRFSKADFIPFAKKSVSYCSKAEIAAANLQFDGKYNFDITPDKTQKTYLDLKKFNPTGQNSIIYSQVRVPSKNRQDGYCWVGATDNITDLGVTLKTSPENILVWVTSLQTAEPQGSLNVEIKDEANRTLWTGSTDENGLAMAPGLSELKPQARNSWSTPAVYVFVTSPGGDAVLASTWNDGLEPWRFNVSYNYSPNQAPVKSALFTERGIYRPGETVYVKGLTRRMLNGQWALPSAAKGTLTVYNSRGDEAFKQTLSYGAGTGAFDWKFTLPENAVTGGWSMSFEPASGEGSAYYSFQVEAVEQADFKVNLRALEPSYVGGQEAQFTASADYLFGSPVSGAQAKWTVRRVFSNFSPEGYEEYTFIPYFFERDFKDHLMNEASGTLDEQGKINFTVPLPQVTSPQQVYAEVGVQAVSGQQLFARTGVMLNPADFYLGAKMDSSSVEQGENAKAHIVAVTPQGQAAGEVEVEAKIQKEEYFSVRKNGLAGRLEWVSERRVKDFPSQTFTVGEKGYDFSFDPTEPGSYQVTLTAKDAQGRQVKGGFAFTVYGKGQAYWKQNDDDILQLEQDKEKYNPGDTARILVKSPYENALALVTVEREGVLDAWTVPVASGADYVQVPIKASYLPNVFVGVTLVRGRAAQPEYDKEGLDLAKPQGKTGYVNLTVSQAEREIQTSVSAGKTLYRPGQEVTVNINTAVQGKGVPADVTLMVVDEGVLSLTGYKRPDLMDAFYSPAQLSVSTADNRVFIIGQRNFGEKGENRGGGGGSSDKLGGADLRSHFEFTPYFNASVRTDARGRGSVKFTLPDNLTTFRIMAVAATVREFGGAETEVNVSKPLMVTAKMPRFARTGDKFQCGAVIYNYEDEKGDITVSARAEGAVRLSGDRQTVNVPKGGAKEVSWDCEAVETGEAKVSFAAEAGKENDGVVSTLTVSDVEKKQTLALYSATNDSQEQVLAKPASVNEKAGAEAAATLASTALINLRGGIVYLLAYPYDCLEQKMSKILPVIEGADMIEDFGLGDLTAYKKQTQEILNEIGNYQSAAGGFAYWPNALPDPYVTAYTLETAYRAKRAGYTVDEAALKRAAAWLKGVFGKDQQKAYPYSAVENDTARAYAVLALSLYGEKMEGQFNNLYNKRNTLSAPAQAYLLLAALHLNQGADVKLKLAQELLNRQQTGNQTVHFSSGEAQPWLHMTDVKVTALALEALLVVGDYLPQPYRAVQWLTDQLGKEGYWINTSANAAVFGALNAYYKLKESVEPDFTASVSLDGKNVLTQSFKGRTLQTVRGVWPFAQVYQHANQARVRFVKAGAGTLYYTLWQTYAPMAYSDSVNAGFEVSRSITDLQGKAVTEFKAGQRYKVTLKTRSTASRSFVVLEDFIPAGFEIVNTSLATESQEQAASLNNAAWGGFERDEKYDDRIVIFADYLTEGEHEYSYLVQASVAGDFAYPSLWASQMYDPAVFGRNATSRMVIKP